ncbi:MAG: TetR/AcrR family transcriptional regulator [Butyrivibrio sp.]|jgi:AcrR family transcriptional regulator|nr:TetR/AcrR family transcriptional regulator [Butyrivibrio sp.]
MNEKFFDLKKEKQDRIINAALKAFAIGGYMHASTDDIVRMAGISKGLIFHYFETKLGLYQFVYNYSTRVINIELATGISRDITDFFSIRLEIEKVLSTCMKQYPYIQLFLTRAENETTPEAATAILLTRESFEQTIRDILDRGDITRFKEGANYQLIENIVSMTCRGILESKFREGDFLADDYYDEVVEYLEMLRELTYN